MTISQKRKEELLLMIHQSFPDISWKDAKFINTGWSSDIIILDNQSVFRFPKTDFTKENFTKECELLSILKGKYSLPVPDYTHKDYKKSFGGYPIIQGTILRKSDLKDEKIRKVIARQLGKFLKTLHSIDISEFPSFNKNISEHYSFSEGYLQYLEDEFLKIRSYIEPNLLKESIHYLHLLRSFKGKGAVMTHYDFQGKNIIFNKEKQKLRGVIDFSDATIYDPAIDFAHLFNFSPQFVREVLESYSSENTKELYNQARLYWARGFIFAYPELIKRTPEKCAIFEKKLQKMMSEIKKCLI